MRARVFAVLVYVVLALGARAGETCSANGRYCLAATAPAAFYQIDYGQRTLLATFGLPLYGTHLVADSGEFVAALPRYVGPLLEIYRTDGSLVRALEEKDVFTPNDVQSIALQRLTVKHAFRFDEELQREVLAVGLPAKIRARDEDYEEIRLDPATGALLDPKRDIYPPNRVWVTSSEGLGAMGKFCGWDRDAVAIESSELVARAIGGALPRYPEVAQKARVSGAVRAEVVVSESGQVVRTCIQGLPFGIEEAVDEAVRGWTFKPYEIDGRPVRVTSDLVFHFKRVDHAEWKEIVLVYNPRAE